MSHKKYMEWKTNFLVLCSLCPRGYFEVYERIGSIITSLAKALAKEVLFLVALVCLSVDNITQKVMNGLGCFFWRVLGSTVKK